MNWSTIFAEIYMAGLMKFLFTNDKMIYSACSVWVF